MAPSPQSPSSSTPSKDTEKPEVTIKSVFLNLPKDQVAIWTSPFHAHIRDLTWLVPLGTTSGLLLGSDTHNMARERSNALAISRSSNVSNFGLGTILAVPAVMYVAGQVNGNSQQRETGLLAGEAVVDSLIVNETLKIATGRARPTATGGDGSFFTSSRVNSSFPSTHAMLSWTAASVIAHEYPGPLTQVLAYGAATAVSISRVTARQHFPSDVVIGSALGWLIGRQVYRAHSTFNDDEIYGTFERDKENDIAARGSVYVPLDSWVYPALKRLAALGYIRNQFTGLQPWTKQECLRQLEDADYLAQELEPTSDIRRLIEALRTELKIGSEYDSSAQIDSVYARYMNIAGTPLRDSYHFGQSISNDFGRPFDQGGNFITGATASAVSGRFFFFVRGEYEHAPGRAANTPAVQNLIFNVLDQNVGPPLNYLPAVPSPTPVAATNRFYPLDMYAGVQVSGYALTFGKQSLWLGPTESGPLMVSDNADPQYMLRLAHTSPFYLPGFLRRLGPIEDEYLFSKLSGHRFPALPFFNLQKFTFHPTENLEIGFTRASLWGGVGHPFTLHSLERNLFALGDTPATQANPRGDIGDRKSGFDFSYRIPGVRNWLTLYSDSYSDDDPSPIANPRRAAVSPGLYLSHVPAISKLDFRVETTSTQVLTSTDQGGRFLYYNFLYHDSNTNKGFLFGNSTGRDARSYQGWTTYHFSPGTTLQFSYRQLKVGNGFLHDAGTQSHAGGTQSDAIGRFAWRINSDWNLDSFVQYERWLIPSLLPTAQKNISASVQLTYYPHWQIHGK
ncbi:MAG TPA: capsule assembly Wzi family protein [Verrucomicrobiae bacterium]|nr:capsule assembly Wzi family protein [Verrucomicrobiae bacterium]